MYLGESGPNKQKIAIGIAVGLPALGFLIAFLNEIIQTLTSLWALLRALPFFENPNISNGNVQAIVLLSCNLVMAYVFFLMWSFLIAGQALYPVRTMRERQTAMEYFFLFLSKAHGPALFVKNGAVLGSENEEKRPGPGVLVIDYNSAVVLESKLPAPSLFDQLLSPFRGRSSQPLVAAPRVLGPGVAFTNGAERIRASVDLRRQNRSKVNVQGYTRDGIEVSTVVWILFTLGLDPEIIQVTYQGERRADNLRTVNIEKLPDGRFRVNSLVNEIDEIDREEIHKLGRVIHHMDNILTPYNDLPGMPGLPVFNRDRIFSAVFSQARDSKDQPKPWTDLPVQVAVDIFRENLSHVNYDQLYNTNQAGPFPLPDVKNRFKNAVRNTGILSYRMVFKAGGQPITPGIYAPHEIMVSPVYALTSSKILRDRGIRVIACGFPDLIPVSEAVYKRRLDTWRAGWDSNTEIIQATRELEAMRLRNRARVQAEKDLYYALSQIFSDEELPSEVVALRVLQSLESVATDPKTRQLLPADTINLMKTLHDWLLPQEKTSGGKG